MANKNINILLKLKDQFTSKLKKSTESVKVQQKQFKAATNTINRWGRSANKTFLGVMSTAKKLGASFLTLGGLLSVAGIKHFASEAISGFNAAKEAETKLEAVLNNVPSVIAKGAGAAAAAKDRLVAFTDQMEETGVIAGDVSVAGLQQLATFQLTEASLSKLAPGMADLIAQQKGLNATQGDAVSIGNLVGKAMTGQTGALSKAGIIMTEYQVKVMKTGTEAERAAMMAEILKQNVGGVNSALAQTDAGRVQVAGNLIGRTYDLIGEKLMGIKGELAGLLIKYMPEIEEKAVSLITRISQWVSKNKETIGETVKTVAETVGDALMAVGSAISFLARHANLLIPILAGVVGGFAAFHIISAVATVLGSLISLVKGLSSGMGILNAVMAANPFTLVAMAIGAVIAAIALLIANFDKVKALAKKVWAFLSTLGEAFKILGTTIKDSIVGAFNYVKNKVKSVFDWFEDKVSWIKDGLGAIGSALGGSGSQRRSPPPYGGKATGTPYFKGGPTRINEGGRGEIVDLPNGTRIIPHDVAKKAQGGTSVVVHLTIQGNVIGNRAFMEQTGSYIANKILAAQGVV